MNLASAVCFITWHVSKNIGNTWHDSFKLIKSPAFSCRQISPRSWRRLMVWWNCWSKNLRMTNPKRRSLANLWDRPGSTPYITHLSWGVFSGVLCMVSLQKDVPWFSFFYFSPLRSGVVWVSHTWWGGWVSWKERKQSFWDWKKVINSRWWSIVRLFSGV